MSTRGVAVAVETGRWRAASVGSLAAVEAALFWRFGWTAPLAAYGCLGVTLTLAAVVDARTKTMPHVLLVPSYPAGVGLLALACSVDGDWWRLGRAVIAMAAVAGLYLVIALVAAGQMGLADVTLGGLLGLLLGWLGWSALTSGVLLGWVAALVAVAALRVVRPGHRDAGSRVTAIPAGPCLWLGALVAILATR